MSISAETPAERTILPLSTHRFSGDILVLGAIFFNPSTAIKWMVVSRFSSNPAFAKMSAPVQTDNTSSALTKWLLILWLLLVVDQHSSTIQSPSNSNLASSKSSSYSSLRTTSSLALPSLRCRKINSRSRASSSF